MNHKNKFSNVPNKPDYDIFSESDIVSSSTECTGLVPTLPKTDFEAEAYSELYKIPKPKEIKDKK